MFSKTASVSGLLGFCVLFVVSPHLAEARGGLGGFHGGGFQIAHMGGIGGMGGLGGMHPGYMGMGGMHPGYMGMGGMRNFHPALSGVPGYGMTSLQAPLQGVGFGAYRGIHTGGIPTPAPFHRLHFQPSMGYYHPATDPRRAEAGAAAAESYYYNNNFYAPDPFYNPYQGLYSDPYLP